MNWMLPVATLLLAGLAGCASSDDAEPMYPGVPVASEERLPAAEGDFSDVAPASHGAPFMHTIRGLHGGALYLEEVGWNDLTEQLPPEAFGTGWAALGLWHNYVCITQFTGTGSVAIVDIEDPANPAVISHVTDALINGDCQFTEDGNYLFAGSYLGADLPVGFESAPLLERGTPTWQGINVWDVSDKADPQHLFFSSTGEYHTHHLHTDDNGTVWVVQAYSGNIYRFDPSADDLELVTTVTPMVHDMWIDTHPITGQTLLFSGAGAGFVVYDFEDPANPVELMIWEPPEDVPRAQGWHRHALSSVLIDGRAILVVSGEDCGAGTRPYIVVDVTDIENPITMGSWELPGTPVSTDPVNLCEFSSHEFALYDGYLITANYHAGVWLIDIGSEERLWEPVTIGYSVPANEPLLEGHPQDLTWPWNPFVWGAEFDERGYIVHGDFSSGLYVLKVPGVTQEA